MKTETYNLTNEGVTLTSYILDYSQEMPRWEKRPVMLVVPGGGYRFCSDREAEPVAMAFAAKGWNTFILRYSLNENAAFPRPLDDADEAMQFIIDHAEEFRADTGRICSIGFSAGGHLCAAMATMGKIKPAATVLCYPCTLKSIEEILPHPIPGLADKVDENTSPAFIVSSRRDTLVPIEHSLRYADALEKAGIDFEMHIYSTGDHGFSLCNEVVYSSPEYVERNIHMEGWIDLCFTWLKKTLGM